MKNIIKTQYRQPLRCGWRYFLSDIEITMGEQVSKRWVRWNVSSLWNGQAVKSTKLFYLISRIKQPDL